MKSSTCKHLIKYKQGYRMRGISYRRLGGESNREINFGFGSTVRAGALDVGSERAQNFRSSLSLFPFRPGEFSLLPLVSM